MGIKENLQEAIQRIGKRNLGIIAVVVIALVAVLLFVLPVVELPKGEAKAIFTLKDAQGQPLKGVQVKYKIGEGEWKSAETGLQGTISLFASVDSTLYVKIEEFSQEGREFQGFEENYFVIEEGIEQEIVLIEKLFLPTTKTILLQGFDGEIAKGSVTANFLCKASEEAWSESNLTLATSISTSVAERLNCGEVVASIVSNAFEDRQISFAENESMKIASLTKKQVPPGKVTVNIVDETNAAITGYFSIRLQKDFEEISEKNTNGYSEAVFEVPPGNYTAIVEDNRGIYGLGNSEEFLVESGKEKTVSITVSKTPKGKITVKVIDKDNLQELEKADVVLKDAKGKIYAKKETNQEGIAEFVVSDLQEYSVTAVKEGEIGEGYFSAEEIKISEEELAENPTITVELEKKTPENTGRVKVTVKDEDGLPVKNALVKFMVAGIEEDGSADYLLLGESKHTDVNGIAEFVLGKQEKPVYPFVTKYPASAKDRTIAKEILLEELNEFEVTMVIGDAVIELEVVSKETGKPLENATYEVFKITGERMIAGERPVFEGKDSLTLKADAKVYFKVKAEGYTTFYTQALQLWPEQTFNVRADLSPKHIIALPSIEFEGIYNELGTEKVGTMHVGDNYRVRLRMKLPEEDNIEGVIEFAKIHFRVGESFTVENDALYIYGTAGEGVFAPGNPTIVKGKTYDESKGGLQEEQLTEGKAKWANILWKDSGLGGAEYLVDVMVSPVKSNAKLPLYYRIELQTVKGAVETFLRDPLDSVLGTAETVGGKAALYAETYEKDFYEGETIGCGEEGKEFCWSNEKLFGRIPNLGDNLQFPSAETYDVSNYSEYEYSFDILNRSQQVYEEMKLVLKLEKEAIEILEYEFENADGGVTTEADKAISDVYRLEFDSLGEFVYNKQVSMKLKFRTKKKLPEKLEVNLIADNVIRFSHSTGFKVVADNELLISVEEPTAEIIAAFDDTRITVKVTDKETGYLLNDVSIKAEVRDPEKPEPLWKTEVVTGSGALEDGIAQFRVPPSDPGSKILINAFKADYVENSVELLVDDEIVKLEPEKLSYELDVKTETGKGDFALLTLKNRTGITWEVTDAKLVGWFDGIINRERMQNFIENSLPLLILPERENDLGTKAFLEEEAGEIMARKGIGSIIFDEEYGAKILLTLEYKQKLLEQKIEVPLSIAVSFGEAPEGGCLQLTNPSSPLEEWQQGMEAGQAVLTFGIENDCYLDGQPIDLEGLQFELIPIGEMSGNIDVVVEEPGPGGRIFSDTLSPNYKSRHIATIEHFRENQKSYTAKIVFKPKPNWEGRVSEFNIEVKGLSGTADREEPFAEVDSNPPEIKGKIANINLQECINLNDGKTVKLGAESDDEFFRVENDCELTDVELRFCYLDGRKDRYCAGGIDGITGGLEVEPEEIKLKPKGDSKEIEVSIKGKKIIGLYGIEVEAKTQFSHLWQPVGEIKAEVQADDGDWLELQGGEYEFDVTGVEQEFSESGVLKNKKYMQEFYVEATECTWEDWETALEYTGIAAISIGGVSAIGGTLAAAMVKFAIAVGIESPVNWIIGGVIAIAAGLIALLTGCDEDEWIPNGPFRDFILKLGHQDVPNAVDSAGNPIAAESGFKDCKLTLGKDESFEWEGTCRQCFGGDVDSLEGVDLNKKAKESAKDSKCSEEKKDLTVNLAWFGMSDLQLTESGAGMPHEALGLKIEKVAGKYVSPRPMYGLLTVNGKYDLVHGDGSEQQAVRCENKNFDNYKVGIDSGEGDCGSAGGELLEENVSGEWQFHLRFNPPISAPVSHVPEMQQCDGVKEGYTGEGVLPRVRFNWSWTGQDSNIEWNACDAHKVDGEGNADYIYCDATQFSIMVSKRLNMLQEFLNANSNSFECPSNWQLQELTQALEAENAEGETQEIAAGSVGLSSLNTVIDEAGGKVKVELKVENKQLAGDDGKIGIGSIKVKLVVRNPQGEKEEREKTVSIFAETEETTIEEEFALDGEGIYTAVAMIVEPESLQDREKALSSAAYYSTYREGHPEQECFLPYSTVATDDITGIEFFINENVPGVGKYVNGKYKKTDTHEPEIEWPDWSYTEWEAADTVEKKIKFLHDLVSFEAYLIKDNYSEDFQRDFAHYYTQINFMDTPQYFSEGFAEYFNDTGRMVFAREGIADAKEARELLVPGKYYVNLAAMFDKEKGWKFFEGEEIIGDIAVLLRKIKKAEPNYIFYQLPFDGEVGKGTENGRQNYGIDYSAGLDEDVYITGSAAAANEFVKLEKISDSSIPLIDMELEKREDLQRLNSMASTRGNLLQVRVPEVGKAKMVFSPNNFSTAVLHMHRDELTEDPFTAEYSLMDGSGAVGSGTVLTYWYGLGNCLDFTAKSVKETFNMQNDVRSSLDSDNYAVQWSYASKIGDVFLATVFYLPPEKEYLLKATYPLGEEGNRVSFVEGDDPEVSQVSLNVQRPEMVEYVADIFREVEKERVCVNFGEGGEMHFWWNPKYVFEEAGVNGMVLDVNAVEEKIIAGDEEGFKCIRAG